MMPEHAITFYKVLIREAARIARNDQLNKCRDSPKLYLANLVLISRLVLQNRSKQARLLMNTSSFFFGRTVITSDCVHLLDPKLFASEFRAAKRRHLEDSRARESSKPHGKRNEH